MRMEHELLGGQMMPNSFIYSNSALALFGLVRSNLQGLSATGGSWFQVGVRPYDQRSSCN